MYKTDYSNNKYLVVCVDTMTVNSPIYNCADDARNKAMDLAQDKEGLTFIVFQSDGAYLWNS